MRRDLKRSAQGARSKAQGAIYEDLIEAECNALWAQGRAKLVRQPTPLKPLRPINRAPGMFEAVLQAQASLDFEGTLRGGRAVYLDAKSTRDNARFNYSLISTDQLTHAADHAYMGGLALIVAMRLSAHGALISRHVLEIDEGGRIAGLDHTRSFNEHGARASLRWDSDEMAARLVRNGEKWLDAVERLGWHVDQRGHDHE